MRLRNYPCFGGARFPVREKILVTTSDKSSVSEFNATCSLTFRDTSAATPARSDVALSPWLEQLRQLFGIDFAVVDTTSGNVLRKADDDLGHDWSEQTELCRQLFEQQRCEFLEDHSPLAALAVPLPAKNETSHVAIGMFLTMPVTSPEDVRSAAAWFKLDEDNLWRWASQQKPREPDMLRSAGECLVQRWVADKNVSRLQSELESVSTNLLNVYEEISLLHRLSQNLNLSSSDVELSRLALQWLSEVVPAAGLAIWFTGTNDDRSVRPDSSATPTVIQHGLSALREDEFESFFARFAHEASQRPVIRNHPVESETDWPYPQIGQFIAVPLAEGENVFGWLLATNNTAGREFGTVEASLLNTVATILGIHSSNRNLYRQQSQFLSEMVRTLTSAVDAKDPYTCGHSDRVARLAVRLGKETGCDEDALNTLYLSGLLHDIGKIGIDDAVLRKPGKLTPEEYAHIKLHPKLGYKILCDLTQLDDVLPVVLHHHETWDGSGYPHGLSGDDTPQFARIVAVADAFDAMSSDRPYRSGMPLEKIEEILRQGAGSQWDATIVDAFFAALDDMCEIVSEEPAHAE